MGRAGRVAMGLRGRLPREVRSRRCPQSWRSAVPASWWGCSDHERHGLNISAARASSWARFPSRRSSRWQWVVSVWTTERARAGHQGRPAARAARRAEYFHRLCISSWSPTRARPAYLSFRNLPAPADAPWSSRSTRGARHGAAARARPRISASAISPIRGKSGCCRDGVEAVSNLVCRGASKKNIIRSSRDLGARSVGRSERQAATFQCKLATACLRQRANS